MRIFILFVFFCASVSVNNADEEASVEETVEEEKILLKNAEENPFNGSITLEVLQNWGFNNQTNTMNLTQRNITTINQAAFTSFTSIEALYFDKNQLNNLEIRVFTGLNRLRSYVISVLFNLIL